MLVGEFRIAIRNLLASIVTDSYINVTLIKSREHCNKLYAKHNNGKRINGLNISDRDTYLIKVHTIWNKLDEIIDYYNIEYNGKHRKHIVKDSFRDELNSLLDEALKSDNDIELLYIFIEELKLHCKEIESDRITEIKAHKISEKLAVLIK